VDAIHDAITQDEGEGSNLFEPGFWMSFATASSLVIVSMECATNFFESR
jgi:hypothetical protein